MRTLTLGVLIVSGGTLAALPFRKYQAIPDASAAPAHITGPTQSALDSVETTQLVNNRVTTDPRPSEVHEQTLAALETTLASTEPRWQPEPPALRPRNAEVPLTYDDFALPIDPPPPIVKRFNATVPIREETLDRERMAALVMPAMEELAVKEQLELQRVAESAREIVAAAEQSRATGSLASSREKHVEHLPESTDTERDRFWIRQPE